MSTPPRKLVQQLYTMGTFPADAVITDLIAQGNAAEPDLLGVAADLKLFAKPAPQCWAPVHALRVLEQIQPSPAIIAPLLAQHPYTDAYTNESALMAWKNDLAHTLGMTGAAGLPLLQAAAADLRHHVQARGTALVAMAVLATRVPELHNPVEADLRYHFAHETDPVMLAFVIHTLCLLRVADLYQPILQAYREKRVHTAFFTAADARKLVLAKHPSEFLAPRTFWDRYDEDDYGEYLDAEMDLLPNTLQIPQLGRSI